jgi:hypothetical protein
MLLQSVEMLQVVQQAAKKAIDLMIPASGFPTAFETLGVTALHLDL